MRVRFWTTGAFAASGTVTVTPLLRTWAFTATLSAATLASVTIPANTSVTTIAVTIPGVTADMASLNGLSFVDLDAAAPGVQLYAASGQIVTLDTSRAIVWNGSAFLIPVIATSSTAPELTVEAQIQAGTVSWTSAQDSDYTGRTAAVAPATVTGATTYIDVTFSPSMGALLTQGSINGDEILLTGVGAAGISLVSGGAVYLHGTTWRFALSGQFAIGAVNVNIKLDAFSDNSGRSPPAGSVLVQSFTVVGSTADAVTTTTAGALTALGGQTVSRETINLLHYLQIRFVGAGGAAIDPSTIDGNEIELRDAAGTLISLAAPIRVGTTDVFRYGLSADLAAGRYTITILGGSFADVNGIANVTETETFTLVSPTAALTDPVRGQVTYVDEFGTRGYVDITFTPAPGATLNVAEILALRPTFSGGGAESLTITSVTRQGTSNVFRFAFTGTFTPGLVTMTLAAGAWRDSAGNASAATTNTFRLIAPAQSFFIELSGGLRLEAGGLTSEPLIDLSASVLLEIDNNRKLFILTFEGQLSIIKLGTVGATSGRFVLDNSDPAHLPPRLWGVASLQTNFDALLPYGLRLSASGTLQINLTNETKVETITLKGVGPGHTDLVQTYTLKPYSFGLELVGLAVVSIPGTSTELMRIQGGLLLDISMAENPSLTMFMTGTLSYGSGSVQITLASATAVLFIRTDAGHAGVAGSVTISAGGDIGLPNLALFSATGTVNLMFNTTLQDQTLELPASFLPLLREGDPTSITVYAAPPDLTGEPPAGAAPAAYVKATVRAQLVFAGVLVLDGYIGITAAGSGAGAYFKVDGALGTQIPGIGAMTALVNLGVYVGANPGVIGRVQLTRGGNGVPGFSFNGQFLLEINTFSGPQDIQTFKIEQTTVNGVSRFGGFAHDPDTNALIVESVTIQNGFHLEFYGDLRILDTLVVTGHVELTISSSEVTLVVNASLRLDPIGSVSLVNSGFSITSAGLVARVELVFDVAAGTSIGAGIGLELTGNALLALNTTGSERTLGSSTVQPGFLLRITGTVNFLNFASASGFVEISVSGTTFQLLFDVNFAFGGLTFHAGGGAAVRGGANPGFAMSLAVSVTAADPLGVFTIEASGTLQLNTSSAALLGLAANSFLLDLTGHVDILKVFTFDATMRVVVGRLGDTGYPASSPGAWYFRASASIDFFGLATLSGSIFLNSNGDFILDISGHLQLGSDSFGISGDFTFHVSSVHYLSPDHYVFSLSGSASVRVRVFGITLIGAGLSFTFGFDTATAGMDGRVKIELSVTVTISLLFFDISKTAYFTIGYLQFPPPTYMAGGGSTTTTDEATAQSFSGGALVLNVGSRGQFRNIGEDDLNESMKVEQIGTTAAGATIKVSGYGRSNTYEGVTSIVADFGDGNDGLVVDPSVTVPLTISGGIGNDTISIDANSAGNLVNGQDGDDYLSLGGRASGTLNGGNGADFLEHTGTGSATLNGGADNDALIGSSATDVLNGGTGNDQLSGIALTYDGGDGDDLITLSLTTDRPATFTGGTGTDILAVTLSGSNDTAALTAAGTSAVTFSLNGTDRATTGIETFRLDGLNGTDLFTVGYLPTNTGVTDVSINLGTGGADRVTVNGSSGADNFTLGYVTRAGRPNPEAFVDAGDYTVYIGASVRAEGDRLVLDTGDGNDILDASAFQATGFTPTDRIALTLIGGNGDDRLVGSPFDDVLDSGAGDDQVTGGTGLDVFIDPSGNDTLIETVTGDVGIYDNLFIVGTIAANGVDFASSVSEDLAFQFENLTLTGGSGSNTYLFGDEDGRVLVGGVQRDARPWTGIASLATLDGADGPRVVARGDRARISITDSAGSDQLIVSGTSQREDLIVEVVSVAAMSVRPPWCRR